MIRWILLGLALALGVLIGIGAGRDYYNHHIGGWEVGASAIAIGAGIAIGSGLLVFVVAWLTRNETATARARRAVIQTVALVLAVSGALAGAGAGYAYQDANDNLTGAILIGVATAFASWIVAALLSLLVEIANSLWRLSRAADPEVAPGDAEPAN